MKRSVDLADNECAFIRDRVTLVERSGIPYHRHGLVGFAAVCTEDSGRAVDGQCHPLVTPPLCQTLILSSTDE